MTIKITTSKYNNATTIRVEGRLNAAAVPDLQREVKLASAPLRLAYLLLAHLVHARSTSIVERKHDS